MIASERDILELLHQRYSKTYSGARRFAVAEHVSNMQNRIADFIAVDSWPVSDFALHGHEIKVSRGDWLAELRQPDKSEAFKRYMDYWWLVVPDRDIVKPGELPAGWGLLAPGRRGGGPLRACISAPRLQPDALSKGVLGGLGRAIAKTAQNRARIDQSAGDSATQPHRDAVACDDRALSALS